MKEILREAVTSLRVDYVDVRLEDRAETRILYAGKNLQELAETHSFGGCVRVLEKGNWGVVSFTDLEHLTKSLFLAGRSAKAKSREKSLLADAPVVEDVVKASSDEDPRDIPLETKKELASEYNQMILRSPGINTSQLFYKDAAIKKYFMNSEGTYVEQERTEAGLTAQAVARDGANVQSAHESIGGSCGFQAVRDLDKEIAEVAARAESLLRAKPARGGKFTCVIDQRLCGTFIHEAFGHMSEADHIFENDRLRALMELGKDVGAASLNAVDDGTIPGNSGTNKYDDEGVRTRKNYLIKEGRISGRLHSRETAGKMGEEVSGNARAIDFRFDPIVRMTNTYIEPRDWTLDEMIRTTERGYYVKGSRGGQTNLDMFTFSAVEAYEIEKGEIKEKVRDLTLTGSVFDTLKAIDA
ncbi:MAG: TldD/PmbA family protein, partial [Armatimonadetes bacterium]|nr:TldD/PmbA family protein [Armatimonadota bacterium]